MDWKASRWFLKEGNSCEDFEDYTPEILKNGGWKTQLSFWGNFGLSSGVQLLLVLGRGKCLTLTYRLEKQAIQLSLIVFSHCLRII